MKDYGDDSIQSEKNDEFLKVLNNFKALRIDKEGDDLKRVMEQLKGHLEFMSVKDKSILLSMLDKVLLVIIQDSKLEFEVMGRLLDDFHKIQSLVRDHDQHQTIYSSFSSTSSTRSNHN
ncbi:hypothetical protein TSUD_46710 [Trifolium subterraneum]|nr:hypothetical protein TSUD_46710 [Trifolium subterraneum]